MAAVNRITRVTLSDNDIADAISAWARSKNLLNGAKNVTTNLCTRRVTTGYGQGETDKYIVVIELVIEGE